MSKEAREAEARDEKTATISFRGETFTVSRDYDDWPVELTDALEQGLTVAICKHALGPSQWRKVQRMGRMRNRDLVPLLDEIARALGFGSMGESPASSD